MQLYLLVMFPIVFTSSLIRTKGGEKIPFPIGQQATPTSSHFRGAVDSVNLQFPRDHDHLQRKRRSIAEFLLPNSTRLIYFLRNQRTATHIPITMSVRLPKPRRTELRDALVQSDQGLRLVSFTREPRLTLYLQFQPVNPRPFLQARYATSIQLIYPLRLPLNKPAHIVAIISHFVHYASYN